ncbi:MAG: ATP-binding protein [Herbaspirillum sp.]|nr:ATP-binding protein [Herbaspirillum sp.]
MEDNALIQRLLFSGEGDALDFKLRQYEFENADDDKKSDLLKDILAFSNAWRTTTAYILIGVRDNPREVVGLDRNIDDSRLQQFINGKTNRPLQFSYRTIEYSGKTVGLYTIPVQDRPTYIARRFGKVKADTVYVRRGSSTTEVKPDEIAKMGSVDTAAQTHSPRLSIKLIDPEGDLTPIDVLKIRYTDFVLDLEEDEILPDFPTENFKYLLPESERHNKDYYRELVQYICEQESLASLRLEIENTGDMFADNVNIFLSFPSSKGFGIGTKESLLDIPSPDSRYRGYYAHDVQSQITYRSERGIVTAIFSIGKIQAGEKITTRRLYLFRPPEWLTEIKIRVLSDQLRSPIELTIPALIEIEQQQLTMYDIDNFAYSAIEKKVRQAEHQ